MILVSGVAIKYWSIYTGNRLEYQKSVKATFWRPTLEDSNIGATLLNQ